MEKLSRTTPIEIDGVTYLMVYSNAVTLAITERYGDQDFSAAIADAPPAKKLREVVWLTTQLINAGARYAKHRGVEAPVISEEDFLDLTTPDDLSTLESKITAAIVGSSRTSVEVVQKN